MTLGIRSKLLLAFVLSILLPAAVAAGWFMYGTSQMQKIAGNEQLAKMQQVNQIVMQRIIDDYPAANRGDVFYYGLKPLLEKYNLELQIESLTGKMVFDSNWFERQDKPGSQVSLNKFGSQAGQSTIPIVIDNEVVANAVMTSNDPAFTSFLARLYSSVLISLALGVLTLVALVIFFTIYLSRSVLKPLQELNCAAERISQGNLDYRIDSKSKDELGKFSHTFDQMRQRLKESLQKQQESEAAKKEMLASISHDLRTPITSIKGYVEGLQDGIAMDEDMFKKYLKVIKDKTEKLDRLIDELFLFSRLDMDQIEISLREENSSELLEDMFSGYEIEFGTDKFKVGKPLPSAQVMADKHKIGQVIDNLVQNARRHAGKQVEISVGASLRNDRLIVAIRDNGSGISEHDLPHVFERFYRGEKSRSRDYGGTGLGLAICKYIIDAHGGEIWVKSLQGKGCTFCFSLPLLAKSV